MTDVTRKEWLLLSRYLDGDLSAEQVRRIEEKLRSDVALRQAFERLLRTRQVLRAVPQRKAPRTYLLSNVMVRVERQRVLPQLVWRYSSIAAALVATIALLLQVFSPRASQASPLSASAQPEMMVLTAPDALDAEPTEQPLIIFWNPGAYGMGGGGEGPSTSMAPAAPLEQTDSYGVIGGASTTEDTSSDQGMFAKEAEEVVPEMADESAVAQEQALPEEQALSAAASPSSNPILGIAPPEKRGSLQEFSAEENLQTRDSVREGSALNFGVIALLALFVSIVCGLVAFILHRKQQKQ